MAGWIRKAFDGLGITQSPTGPYLDELRACFGGTVVLMIDVSGSMSGQRLQEAAQGGWAFVDEATEAHYSVGLILWDHGVEGSVPPEINGASVRELLRDVSSAGGTDLYPSLVHAHEMLTGLRGDRVVAIFGDGDIGSPRRVLDKVAQMKGEGIRFVTRGLGQASAQQFAEISDEEIEAVQVESVDGLATGIASMAQNLRGSSALRAR